MKRLLFFALILAALPLTAHAASLAPYSHCGTERWHIKTLDDPHAGGVITQPTWGFPIDATVSQLRSLPVPARFSVHDDTVRYTHETTVYRVHAKLVGFKEEADRDLHLVIEDGGGTMIAEIPDPQCSTVEQGVAETPIARVRHAFLACFAQPLADHRLRSAHDADITLTGVGFFDAIHGQTGVAPNGFELHPVLRIVAPSCSTQKESAP